MANKRYCDNCVHHKPDGCESWECEYEAKGDLISRQDAIEAVKNALRKEDDWFQKAIASRIEMLPSAEPRYMGCHGCVHYDHQQTALICRDCKRSYRDMYEDGDEE